ncbi:UTP--glucose-1-phosphate uridylyltransferase [Marispirochaeta aestuarii]|uniref:UTP--glucose-1-phosphate uridylyltransferase n=1 Tax=Marispirochaeta aestuarii TaxID=1963862 RepID=A0A1Y1RWN0_9SPIO|nr:UTP--glucose-1-phosphate uridylyltransferase GalU [Marispirochaeta aestuarii]ORC34624.1 UTP--glucose-1-phosphate uridylyltransferase [Marispirochaeta aestuarii]
MVRKAVIPAAGYGTRFLPATKSQPKEMLPVVDTPTIQYVVNEAVESGIKDILLIIGRGKRAIEEHFARNYELEELLKAKGKEEELRLIQAVPGDVNIHFVWQHEQNGLGDAIRYARDHVGNEPFAVLLGDTVLESSEERPVTRQLMDVYNRYEELVVALEEVPRERVSRYGVIDGKEIGSGVYLVEDMVEKPSPAETPSNLVIASRYILPPEIFRALENTKPGKGGEIQLTDAMRILLADRAMYGYRFKGRRHDLGDKLEFLKTSILYALKREDMRDPLLAWMRDLVQN